MKSYQEKLKDPRWQKRRLEIFERDSWKCTICGNDKITLHIHHKEYDGDPWDAPSQCLETLLNPYVLRIMKSKHCLCSPGIRIFTRASIISLAIAV